MAESIKRDMATLGATHALMSGSGPSVYGIFTDKVTAEGVVEHFAKQGIRAYYATTV